MDDGSVRPGERGDDEADPGEELSQVMLDLGDHPPRPVPRRGLIREASIPHQRGVAGSASGPAEQVLVNGPLEAVIGNVTRVLFPSCPCRFLGCLEADTLKEAIDRVNDVLIELVALRPAVKLRASGERPQEPGVSGA
jgi:hypothetical protein